jgi:cytochrome c1
MSRILAAGMTAVVAGALFLAAPPARAEEGTPALPNASWSFSGPFGTYNRAAAQRGFQVYNEVCSACHSMKYMAFRNLAGIGL